MRLSPEIQAAQAAYAARPYAVRWVDSHGSGTFRFDTFAEAFDYVQEQWARIQRKVATERYRASHLRRSHIETPQGNTPLPYWLLAEDVSSY